MTLLDDPVRGLRIDVERHSGRDPIRIHVEDGWMEALVLRPDRAGGHPVPLYVRLPPDSTWRSGSGVPVDLVRCNYKGPLLDRVGLRDGDDERPRPVSVAYRALTWIDTPPRRPGDVGARVVQLFRTASGALITTLVEGRPHWELEEHSHPVDVASICVRGGGMLTDARRTWRRQPLQVALIPAGTPHGFVADRTGVLLFVVVFPPGTL